MKKISYIFIIFLTLVALYFSPIHLPSKLAGPVTFLGLMALVDFKRIGLLMGLGLMLSALGDWQGTQGNFMGQMAFFGLAHVAYICYFVSRLKNIPKWKDNLGVAIPWFIILGGWAFIHVVPEVPEGMMRIGVSIYCVLILTMLSTAFLQRDWLFALGAFLFVVSDLSLAWNKFLGPIPYVHWYIMVPYYGAQWCLFYRATSVASGACSCTSQGK